MISVRKGILMKLSHFLTVTLTETYSILIVKICKIVIVTNLLHNFEETLVVCKTRSTPRWNLNQPLSMKTSHKEFNKFLCDLQIFRSLEHENVRNSDVCVGFSWNYISDYIYPTRYINLNMYHVTTSSTYKLRNLFIRLKLSRFKTCSSLKFCGGFYHFHKLW